MTREDAISRQAVIDSLHSKFADGFDSDRWWNSMSVLYAINKVPSVSTKKTGRWEDVQFRTIPYNRISKAKKCSVCGKRKDKYVTWNYCPNCGSYNGGGNNGYE